MNILKTTFLLLLTTFGAYGQSTENSKDTDPIEWKTLSEDGFDIQYPSNWTVEDGGLMGIELLLFSPLVDAADDFRENVNLLIQDISASNMTLEQYAELSENQIKTLINDGNLISSEQLQGHGLDYHKVVYTGTQGIFELKFEQFYWVIDGQAYVLTFTCKAETFEDYQAVGEQILESFKIKH